MYKIVGRYNGGHFEELDMATTKNEAKYLTEEYRLAYGCNWTITYYLVEE